MTENWLDYRLFGTVEWYGGINKNTNRENRFGFVSLRSDKAIQVDDKTTLSFGSSIFVHESGLCCEASDLSEDRWITFQLGNGPKGVCALKLNLLELETDPETIVEILPVESIPLDLRVKLSFLLPLTTDSPYLEAIELIMNQFNQEFCDGWLGWCLGSTEFPLTLFPEAWRNLEPESPIYRLLPKALRFERFERNFPQMSQLWEQVLEYPRDIIRETDYELISDQDRELAMSWCVKENNYEKAKMLSARGAEKLAADFFRSVGYSVEDIAFHQLSGESMQWKTHDLLLDSCVSIDVKNARTAINSETFVEYTVKRFKKDHAGRDVFIIGVLSPYMTLDIIETASGFVKILGITSIGNVDLLEKEFSNRELTVHFGEPTRWPIWIFNHDMSWFSGISESLNKLPEIMTAISEHDWNNCPHYMIPFFLCIGADLPPVYREEITDWQNWYCERIIRKSKTDELSLPWLYLFTFHHFIDAITNVSSAEKKGYSPDGYRLIYPHPEDSYLERPACIIDPLRILDKLISTLQILWDNRHSAELHTLRKYVLKGEGLLRAVNNRGRLTTVLAYCGGFIQGKGKCGYSPLVIGVHDTCQVCNMLVCGKCGFCSQSCADQVDHNAEEIGWPE